MSNLLAFPFKKTFVIPVAQTAQKYIQDNLPDSNPDAFKWDLKEWEALRKRTLSDVIHVDLIPHFLECVIFQAWAVSRLIFVQLPRPAGVHPNEASHGCRYIPREPRTPTETLVIPSDRTGDPVFTSIFVLQHDTHITNKPHIREMWSSLQPGFSLLPDRLRRGQIKSGRT